MEYLIAPFVHGLRAARKPVVLAIGVAALVAIPGHGFAAQNNPLQNSPSQTSVVNFPASNAPTSSQNIQADMTPGYKPGDPLYVNAANIQAASQVAQTQEAQPTAPQAVAPADVMQQEILSLNVRLSSCQNNSACSPLNNLQILTDASDALHESLLRIHDECAVLDTTTCLSRQYTELQQWSALNGQMGTMLQSVATAAGNAQTMVMSQGAPPAGSELNNMEPAAGNPVPPALSP